MARQDLVYVHQVCDCASGGRESDLISINCEGPVGILEPHMVFGALSQRAYRRGQHREMVRCTHSL